MKNKYTYLIAFAYEHGHGSLVLNCRNKIRGKQDIINITDHLEQYLDVENLSIMNFILLDKKWGFGEWLVAIAELSLLVGCILSMIAAIFG